VSPPITMSMANPQAAPDNAALNEGLLALLGAQGALLSIKQVETGAYLWANPAMMAFLGLADLAQLQGSTDAQLLPMADAQAIKAAEQRAAAAGQPTVVGEHRFERGGRALDFRCQRLLLPASNGGSCLLTAWWDDTQRHHEAARLQQALVQIERHQADLEQLRREHAQGLDRPVDLFRREHFEEHLRREVALSQREHREFALLLLAVDRLDIVQSQHGAAATRRLVEAIAQILRVNTRAMDVLAQLGDDRYAVLLSGVGLATAYSRAEHLRRSCASHLVVQDGRSFGFEVSLGVAAFPHSADNLEDLSQAAVRALHDARQHGGNRVALATVCLGDQALPPAL